MCPVSPPYMYYPARPSPFERREAAPICTCVISHTLFLCSSVRATGGSRHGHHESYVHYSHIGLQTRAADVRPLLGPGPSENRRGATRVLYADKARRRCSTWGRPQRGIGNGRPVLGRCVSAHTAGDGRQHAVHETQRRGGCPLAGKGNMSRRCTLV